MSDNHTIEITEGAIKTLTDMQDRVAMVRSFYGDDEGHRVATSLAHCLVSLLKNASYIGSDGDLSLITTWHTGLTVGMVFHRESIERTCKRHRHGEDMAEFAKSQNAPESGEWSLHS